MNYLWLTWKDKKNPLAGGAELVNNELAKRLVKDGHEVLFLVGGYKKVESRKLKVESEEIRDGFKIIRLGNRFTVYWQAYRYYKKNLVGWADLVIDEINTIPFFAKYYAKEKNILFVHQLAREIWFYEMFFPLSLIGYLLEPVYLWLLRDRKVITISESSKQDLLKYGFKKENISIISEGVTLTLVRELESNLVHKVHKVYKVIKYERPTVLSFGSVRAMKRTLDVVKAFEIAKINIPKLRLKIAGDISGKYGDKVKKYIDNSKYKNDIDVLARVNKEKKIELMQKSHLICVTSIKEGWGLVVTEANSQGTPAVVYNVDGLRDSVRHNKTGLVCDKNTPKNLAEKIVKLLVSSSKNFQLSTFYFLLQKNAWEWSKEINFDRCCEDFKKIIKF